MISSPVYPSRPARRRGLAARISIGLIAMTAVLGLTVAGVTFGALAIAFEIAVPIAYRYHVAVSAADMAMAARFADFWWVFGGLSIASLVGAGVVTVKAIMHLDVSAHD